MSTSDKQVLVDGPAAGAVEALVDVKIGLVLVNRLDCRRRPTRSEVSLDEPA